LTFGYKQKKGFAMHPQELTRRIKSRKAPIIVDVRSGIEFRSGHIPGSIHAPLWKILLRVAQLPSDKSAELVLTCEHGPRAQLAKGLLASMGYRNIILLAGHMAAWRQGGHPQQKL